MRRYVRRGATGIAIIDNSGSRPFLRYVFDVADTGGGEDTRPKLWKYQEEYQDTVSAALAQRFDVPGSELSEQFEKIAAQLAAEYWNEHRQDILHIVDGSFLEEYDEFNIGAQFRNAAAVSIAYTLMSRCGLEPENYFEHEDFLSIFDFNTPDTLTELGTAVSQGSEAVLRQIEVTIKNMSGKNPQKGTPNMENNLTYTQVGDYLIPNLALPEQPDRDLGRYGRMRRTYLKEHRPGLFNRMTLTGTLFSHLLEIEDAANSRLEQMMPQLAKAAGATEQLKASDQMKWVGLMNTCKAQAEEIIMSELIYS